MDADIEEFSAQQFDDLCMLVMLRDQFGLGKDKICGMATPSAPAKPRPPSKAEVVLALQTLQQHLSGPKVATDANIHPMNPSNLEIKLLDLSKKLKTTGEELSDVKEFQRRRDQENLQIADTIHRLVSDMEPCVNSSNLDVGGTSILAPNSSVYFRHQTK